MSLKEAIYKKAEEAILAKTAFLLFLPNKHDVVKDHGVEFNLHYFNAELLRGLSNPPERFAKEPLLPPFDEGLYVCDVAEHYILINKFMQKRGHIVISSKDVTADQGERLTNSDFLAFEKILCEFGGQGICYYNSGIESGCTQLHKHLQFLPTGKKPLFDAMTANQDLPFIYHATKLKDGTASAIAEVYSELMDRAKHDPSHPAYNFIVSDGKAVLVPRRKAQHACGLVINSIGICGNLSLWNWSDSLARTEPMSIIRDLCIPK